MEAMRLKYPLFLPGITGQDRKKGAGLEMSPENVGLVPADLYLGGVRSLTR